MRENTQHIHDRLQENRYYTLHAKKYFPQHYIVWILSHCYSQSSGGGRFYTRESPINPVLGAASWIIRESWSADIPISHPPLFCSVIVAPNTSSNVTTTLRHCCWYHEEQGKNGINFISQEDNKSLIRCRRLWAMRSWRRCTLCTSRPPVVTIP